MSGKFDKVIRQMPSNARETLYRLINDIKATGPVQPRYHNYSRLGENTYHCHLAYRWVACWRNERNWGLALNQFSIVFGDRVKL